MATFVLVHGAFIGGWAWRWVAPELRLAGHEVFTPTLTGHGDRAHLARPETDLDTHIEDVVNLLRYEDLTAVILVGWSYGGMPVAGVADRIPGRMRTVKDGASDWRPSSMPPSQTSLPQRGSGSPPA